MIKAVATGIYSLVTGTTNNFKTAIGSRFYYPQAPQVAVFPYATWEQIGGDRNWDSMREWENIRIRIKVYTANLESASTLGDILAYAMSLFDQASITISGYTQLTFFRITTPIILPVEDQKWLGWIDYRLYCENNNNI